MKGVRLLLSKINVIPGSSQLLPAYSKPLPQASLRCVARHGRFLEIGKYDLSEDNAIGLSVFLKNISFHGILLDALFEAGNSSWQEVSLTLFPLFINHSTAYCLIKYATTAY